MADWWRGAVIYQIYPRSFQDSNGDGIGDLEGITERLPYVADLGVDAIWLSPDLHLADGRHGLRRLRLYRHRPDLRLARRLRRPARRAPTSSGSRSSSTRCCRTPPTEHPFFKESRSSRDNPKADWYVWADPKHDGTPPNNWLSVFGGPAWAWDAAAAPVLSAQLPRRAARLQLPQPGGAGLAALDHALLARARRRRLPPRHRQLLLPRQAAARRPGRLPRARTGRRPTPTPCSTTSSRRTSRRTSSSSSGCGGSSTSTRPAPWSARWARATTRSG